MIFPPYTFPDQWGPTWSTKPAQRGGPPPWVGAPLERRTREEVGRESMDMGFGGWNTIGTSGSWEHHGRY